MRHIIYASITYYACPQSPPWQRRAEQNLGSIFLAAECAQRIFRLDRQERGIPVVLAQKCVCAALTGYLEAELRLPLLRKQRVEQRCWRGIDADQNVQATQAVIRICRGLIRFAAIRYGKTVDRNGLLLNGGVRTGDVARHLLGFTVEH